ncbi:MAG: hypothetical protein COA73_18015 [Candidatus Hydrogenedentota bacterium]|nr:MAG: hypothetical protein COA73_18015 [Candidatus Hydrogenedentota bacterium]
MNEECSQIHELMSGYLDVELDPADRLRLEAHVAGCTECRAELEAMTDLVAASNELTIDMPPDEVWDAFQNNVLARLERGTGWALALTGLVVLMGIGLYYMVVLDWASPGIKLAVEMGLAGLVILFFSVLRQRLVMRRHDRYSRDVHR